MIGQGAARITGVRFADALDEGLAVAGLSPSSHNCQPWAVAWLPGVRARRAAAKTIAPDGPDAAAGREYVLLALDRDRRLGALPAHADEMLISCGVYWRVLRRALAAQGWRVSGQSALRPGAPLRGLDLPAAWEPLCVAEFQPGGAPDESVRELRDLARRRRTNRAPYTSENVDPKTLDALARPPGAPGADGTPVLIRHLTSHLDLERFAGFVARNGGRDFAHRDAWRETHSFIRWSDAEASARGDGFTFAHLFGPLPAAQWWLRRAALAPATMGVLRLAGYPRFLAGQLARVVRTSPAIALMTLAVKEPAPPDLLCAGGALADYWLGATREGLALHPISIVLQHEDLRGELRARFGLTGRPFFVARLGHPAAAFPSSPRRPRTEVLRVL
ncbi:RedV protein [Actinomadura rubrisoli]|uniref:RedV protein n=1 Tax=Actinomadura rubrisoli TaxID=2530368 RepID=UPI0014043841|nr:RedV protein [Actinomadura rubrisoli]